MNAANRATGSRNRLNDPGWNPVARRSPETNGEKGRTSPTKPKGPRTSRCLAWVAGAVLIFLLAGPQSGAAQDGAATGADEPQATGAATTETVGNVPDLPETMTPPPYQQSPEPLPDPCVVADDLLAPANESGEEAVCDELGMSASGSSKTGSSSSTTESTTANTRSGGGGGTPMALAFIDTEEYRYGHWRGVGFWFQVTNDNDAKNRYYATVTHWWGQGTSDPNSDFYSDNTQVWHLARGWAGSGNTFLHDFDPLNENAGTGTVSFTLGWPPAASYTWTQERPAQLRYGLWDLGANGWDDQEYGNKAIFHSWAPYDGKPYFRGKMEYGAAGVVPTGQTGYMYLTMKHTSWACGGGHCDQYVDDTGWKVRPINWA